MELRALEGWGSGVLGGLGGSEELEGLKGMGPLGKLGGSEMLWGARGCSGSGGIGGLVGLRVKDLRAFGYRFGILLLL